jgi:hypothetical protein
MVLTQRHRATEGRSGLTQAGLGLRSSPSWSALPLSRRAGRPYGPEAGPEATSRRPGWRPVSPSQRLNEPEAGPEPEPGAGNGGRRRRADTQSAPEARAAVFAASWLRVRQK